MTEVSNLGMETDARKEKLLQGIAAPMGGVTSKMVANYRISGVLGAGGSAVVYSADDVRDDKSVALKIPLPDVLLDPERRDRFVFEATMLAGLDHANLVKVYEAGVDGPVPFIAMECCDGSDLEKWLEQLAVSQQPLPQWQDVAKLIATVADTIDYVHQQGISHRDLKPANILLSQKADLPDDAGDLPELSQFDVKVSDFGLSKPIDSANQTRSSIFVGTPLYMAPEQLDWRHENSSFDTNCSALDVYSLGAILYQLLTGRTPIQGQHFYEVLENVRNPKISPLSQLRPDLPKTVAKRLERICAICLRRNPEARYQTAGQLAQDLLRCVDDQPIVGHWIGIPKSFAFWLSSQNWYPVAGWYAIACSFLMMSWLALTALGAKQHSVVDGNDFSSLINQSLMLFFTSMIPMGLIGWGCFKEMRWALGIGLVLNSFNLVASICGMIGRPLMFQEIYFEHDIYFCFTIHLLIFLLYLNLQILFLFAFFTARPKVS